MRCPNCDAEIVEGARFCNECGRPVAVAATGATERLPEDARGPLCAACGTRNPSGAAYCVICGRPLTAAPPADPPAQAIPPTPQPAPPTYVPPVPPGSAAAPRSNWSKRNPAAWGGFGAGVFLIGLALIAWLNWWWPGILVLIGITSLIGSFVGGRPWAGLQSAVWLLGLALIAQFNWWWPGILVLVGISILVGSAWRPRHTW